MTAPGSHSKQVVVFRYGQLGDTIAAIPAIEAVRRHFPGRRLVLLSETLAQENHLGPRLVLGPTGLVDEFVTYPRAATPMGILAAMTRLRALAKESEALVYLAPTIRSQVRRLRDVSVFRLAGFPRILGSKGFPKTALPRTPDGTLCAVMHETDALLARLAEDGISVPAAGNARIDLRLQADEQQVAAQWLRGHALSGAGNNGWFAICPGSKWSSKCWPFENYAELGIRLARSLDLTPVVVGGKEDQKIAADLIAHWGCGVCAAGELGVREAAALMAHARFYVGNDTGAMHLAAAVGTPSVGIFAAQDWPGRWDPYGKNHHVLRTAPPCAGCKLQECPNQNTCLTAISVTEVFDVLQRIHL